MRDSCTTPSKGLVRSFVAYTLAGEVDMPPELANLHKLFNMKKSPSFGFCTLAQRYKLVSDFLESLPDFKKRWCFIPVGPTAHVWTAFRDRSSWNKKDHWKWLVNLDAA